MESELLHAKERLAVERRAQQQLKPLTGDSAGAAWAHMRQRLSRAEREARAARRLSIALFCVSLAGVVGILTVVLPRSASLWGRRGAGEAVVWARGAHDPLFLPAGPSP